MEAHAPNEERTAHHVRRLHASIRDLQNALGVFSKTDHPKRPHSSTITTDTPATDDPSSRIRANNERGFIHRIERLQDIGAVVLGLQGVGALVADSLCRYGVKRLVVGDATEIDVGDMDFATYYVHDIGKQRDHHVAATARRLNPEVDVFSLGLPLVMTELIIETLTGMLVCEEDTSSSDESDSDESSNNSDDEEPESAHDPDGLARQGSVARNLVHTDDGLDDWDELCFNVIFLCGVYPDLAMSLNELCCEFGIQLVYVMPGKNGISGDILSVVPGRSACLHCFEKRKILKISTTGASSGTDSNESSSYSASLPSTECVLAGIAVQHAFSHFLEAGPICSRVEYDGYLEELDRSGFIAPVHHCPSQHCRDQQQQHSG